MCKLLLRLLVLWYAQYDYLCTVQAQGVTCEELDDMGRAAPRHRQHSRMRYFRGLSRFELCLQGDSSNFPAKRGITLELMKTVE